MVAYSFKRQFAEPILAGTKGGTIRGDRRRHARPGEEVQLYSGMRTKQCWLIARKQCVAVEPIHLNFAAAAIAFDDPDETLLEQPELLDEFARFDGFSSWWELVGFWHRTHGCDLIYRGVFTGWHIRWSPPPWEHV